MRSLFFLARHGETKLNEDGNYRGWSNGPDAQLNKDGLQSAHDAAKFLVSLKQSFSKIICSPLDRTQLTAAIIAEYLGLADIEIDDRLRPLNVGDLAGQPKKYNPVTPYLENKNKRFPGGETVNEFESRQHEFADELLELVQRHSGILIVAHVSNIMYWWNVQTGEKSDEYLGETSDIVLPGGVAMVTENTTIPIFKPNPESVGIFEEPEIDVDAIRGEPGTGFEVRGGKGPFECGNCEYFKNGNACSQKDMKEKSKQPRHKNGDVVVAKEDCCEFVDRIEEK